MVSDKKLFKYHHFRIEEEWYRRPMLRGVDVSSPVPVVLSGPLWSSPVMTLG